MANNVQDIYSEDAQIKFAREMAKLLLKGRGAGPSASMAVLPGSWMYNVRDITDALSGAQYRDIAGSQEKLNKDLLMNPDAQPTLRRYGSPISQVRPSGAHGTHAKSLLDHARELAAKGGDVITKAVKTIPIKLPSAAAPEEAAPTPEAENADIETGAIPDGSATAAPDAPAVDPRVGNATPDNFLAELDKALVSVPEPQKGKLKSLLMQKYSQMTMRLGRPPSMKELKEGGTLTAGDRDLSAPSMNLGGPKIEDVPAHLRAKEGETEVQLAQNYTSQPGRESPTSKGQQIPGNDDPPPDIPYYETKEEARARMRLMSPEKAAEYMADYQKRGQPYFEDRKFGRIQITPTPGGGGTYKFIPSEGKRRLEPGGGVDMVPYVTPDGKIDLKPAVPGMSRNPGSGVKSGGVMGEGEDAVKDLNRVKTELSAADKLMQSDVDSIVKARAAGEEAAKTHQMLSEMEIASKTGKFMTRGPISGISMKVRQFLDNIGISISGTPEGEILSKLNGYLASRAIQTFSDRGSNLELETFMRANPGLLNTKEGTETLIDIMKQEAVQQMRLAKMANEEQPESAREWRKRVAKFYEDNPIYVKHGDKTYTTQKVTRENYHNVKKGHYYLAPNGEYIQKQ